jgi:hypothetical protein
VSVSAAPKELFNCPIAAAPVGLSGSASPLSVGFREPELRDGRRLSFTGNPSVACAVVVAARLLIMADFAIDECWLCLRAEPEGGVG